MNTFVHIVLRFIVYISIIIYSICDKYSVHTMYVHEHIFFVPRQRFEEFRDSYLIRNWQKSFHWILLCGDQTNDKASIVQSSISKGHTNAIWSKRRKVRSSSTGYYIACDYPTYNLKHRKMQTFFREIVLLRFLKF